MIVLPNRRCGTPTKGGLYAIGRKGVFGTLQPFTAIAAPLPAEVANPRKPEVIDVTRTLTGLAGLIHVDPHVNWGRFARLPRIGIADFWGQSQGYKSVWDVIEETQRFGVCRRVASVPSVPLPCPVLMLHAEAVVDFQDRQRVVVWLDERLGHGNWYGDFDIYRHDAMVDLEDQPWREAQSLGRLLDDTYLWHPYVGLWRIVPQLRERRLFKKFREECGVRFEEGIFGVSWVTDFCHVLEDDETEVPAHLAEKGVVGAFTEDDSRAKEADNG